MRLAFLGLVAAPLVYVAATASPVAQTVSDNLPLMAIAGLLVGSALPMAPAVPVVMACADLRGFRCVPWLPPQSSC